MIITNLGHAKFLIELENGHRIITDPFDPGTGYPVGSAACDTVLVSHHHHDHDAVETLRGYTQVIDAPGEYTPCAGVRVTGVASFHDDAQGAKRGKNTMYLIEAEGLRVAHLGDLGHLPDAQQIEALAPVDVLMVPVGGFFTIDAETARQVCTMLSARVVLPMHFRTECNAGWPIAPVDGFTALFPTPAETLTELRVTREDLVCQPRIAVLTAQVKE